jgi:hypothetical protein
MNWNKQLDQQQGQHGGPSWPKTGHPGMPKRENKRENQTTKKRRFREEAAFSYS